MLITLFGGSFKVLQSHGGLLMLWLFFATHHWPLGLDLRENVLARVCNYISNKVHLPPSVFLLELHIICPIYSHSLGPSD